MRSLPAALCLLASLHFAWSVLRPSATEAVAGIPLRVIDAAGQPVEATVDLAPYVRGGEAAELFSGSDATTDQDGRFLLPVPKVPSIVRVKAVDLIGWGAGHQCPGSSNVLLDPSDLPRELTIEQKFIRLVLLMPRTPWNPDHELRIEDELGIVVARASGKVPEHLLTHVVPGSYVVRRFAGDREVGALRVVVDGAHGVPAP